MVRLGLGMLRLESAPPDEAREALIAALGRVAFLDTARSYRGSEALLAGVDLRGSRIVTKCGMTRDEAGAFAPDGRASTILADAEASTRALGRVPDVLLLHAPDPTVSLETSVRALVRAKERGLARAIGVSNVTRGQLDRIDVPLDVVEVALGPYDDAAARGGVVAWCRSRGATLLAYAALGGPKRARRLAKDGVVAPIARRRGTTAAVVMLAYLRALDEVIVPLVGAKSARQIEAALEGSDLVLDDAERAALDDRFPGLALARPRRPPAAGGDGAQIVLVMGIAGSGKSRFAERLQGEGYVRLNRDELGGTLAGVARRLDAALREGERRIVLDNTYLSRASRSEIVRLADRRGATVRCVHVATPLVEAQQNVARRMIERHGRLLGGVELTFAAKADPGLFAPPTLARMERQLEVPADDEGFVAIEVRRFAREPFGGAAALVIPLELLVDPLLAPRTGAAELVAREPDRHLVIVGWREGKPEGDRAAVDAAIASVTRRPHALALCFHPGGPPVCWCRPPLPGLWVELARVHALDARQSVLLASSPTHRTMARNLGIQVAIVEDARGQRP